MDISEVLRKVGLTGKEADVYVALLELGTASVHSIALKAGIKRPTAYLVLEQLQGKGLVSVVPRSKKALFAAESPEHILSELGRREELLRRAMPQLLARYGEQKDKPQVQLFEGREGIAQVYQKIYASNEVWFFGTVNEALKYDPDDLWDFVRRTQGGGMRVRDLLTRTPGDISYARRAAQSANYQIRFAREGSGFLTDNAIFGDSVAFFNFNPTIFSVVITSRQVSRAIRTLFEFAWEAGEPCESVLQQNAA